MYMLNGYMVFQKVKANPNVETPRLFFYEHLQKIVVDVCRSNSVVF